MTEQEVMAILDKVGAIITNSHFRYTSGLHGSAYINKDAVYPHTAKTSLLCRALAEPFSVLGYPVEVVIGPAIGGVILSQRTADRLSEIQGDQVLSVYAEKEGDTFVIKRGYDKLIAGKRVLVVEDVLTTGGSARKVIEAVRAVGGIVIGLSVLCNRGGVTVADVGDPPRLNALMNLKLETYEPSTCPLCAQGIPINRDIGKGREFLARKQG